MPDFRRRASGGTRPGEIGNDLTGWLWHRMGRMQATDEVNGDGWTRQRRKALGATALLVIAACALLAAHPQSRQRPRFPRAFPEVGITLIDEWTADVDLSADGRRLAYARRDPRDWYFDLQVTRPSGREQECVACELPEPSKHRGSPNWHPSGEFIAFSAENSDVRTRRADRLAEPGTALNTNLWVMTTDGTRAWQLTEYATDYKEPRGVLAPTFSPDGKRLAWTGPVNRAAAGRGFEWGEWAIFLADFDVEAGVPVLRDVRTVQPGQQHSFYQVDDWSSDGSRLLLSANPRAGQGVAALDICRYNLASGSLHRLTQTADWDHHAHYSADGREIIWASTRDLGVKFRSVEGLNWRRDIKTDLWAMNAADGSAVRRLTSFNTRGHRDHTWFRSRVFAASRVFLGDNVPLLDGTRIVAVLGYEATGGQINGALAVIDLAARQVAETPAR